MNVSQPVTRPKLLVFFDPRDGYARKLDGHLAQVLQHGRNHETFQIYRIDIRERPDLVERFRIEQTPAICVVDRDRVAVRACRPRGPAELVLRLRPWLRR